MHFDLIQWELQEGVPGMSKAQSRLERTGRSRSGKFQGEVGELFGSGGGGGLCEPVFDEFRVRFPSSTPNLHTSSLSNFINLYSYSFFDFV